LIFRTSYFSVSGSSVLHSGIYNREFSSMLSSMAAAGAAYAFMALRGSGKIYAFGVLAAVALLSFPIFRQYVFRDRTLVTTLDGDSGRVRISLEGFRRRLVADILMSDVKDLLIETKKPLVSNADGVAFVKKISLQHNTPIPGFGDETLLYMLTLKLADGSDRVIFADSSMTDAVRAYDSIKAFLEKHTLS